MVLQKGGNEGGKYIVSFVEMGKISSLISCMKTDGWNERRNHLSQRNKDYQFPWTGRRRSEALWNKVPVEKRGEWSSVVDFRVVKSFNER